MSIGRSARAFTLIELLVVISIIVLLIGILLPALGQAKQVAIDVKCSANLKGLATSVHTYASDNKTAMVPFSDLSVAYLKDGMPYGFNDFATNPLGTAGSVTFNTLYSDRLVGGNYLGAPGRTEPDSTTPIRFTAGILTCPDAPATTFTALDNNKIPTQYYLSSLGGQFDANGVPVTEWYNSGGDASTSRGWTDLAGIPGITTTAHATTYSRGYMGPDSIDKVASASEFVLAGDCGMISNSANAPNTNIDLNTWWMLGTRSTSNTWGSVNSNNLNQLAHRNKPNVVHMDGSGSTAPNELRDLWKQADGTDASDMTQAITQKAARFFHPVPPTEWLP